MTEHRTLLIVDDDKIFRDAMALHFEGSPFRVLSAGTAREALEICSDHDIDIVLLDQKLPDGLGVDLCPKILSGNDNAKIVFITAYPDFETARDAIRMGAYDYLSKPFEIDELEVVIDRAGEIIDLERTRQIQQYREKKEESGAELIGKNGGLSDVFRIIGRAAESASPVLITGETGTGKTCIAKYIHYCRPKRGGSFIGVNCASLPQHLVEAELFGHEKGAFTGAVSSRKGLFEMAVNGTLLLDEIGELSPELQAKLLGTLDDGRVRRLGGTVARAVDVRIMAATNADLEDCMASGRFRPDLFYRLGVIRIHAPPLRERTGDIPALCRRFIEQLSPDRRLSLPEDELCRLADYPWPGNIRELRNIVERAIILRDGDEIRPSALLESQSAPGAEGVSAAPCTDSDGFFMKIRGSDPPDLESMQKVYIQFMLEKYEGNRTRAARALGVSRSTLFRKLKKH